MLVCWKTRAKSCLVIHVNTSLFSGINIPEVNYEFNPVDYPEPTELAKQLGCRDVKLGFIKGETRSILELRSGQEFSPISNQDEDIQLELLEGRQICILSNACKERVHKLFEKGYELASAK